MAKKKRAASQGQLGDIHKMFTEFLAHRLRETNPNRKFTEEEMELNEETGELEEPFVFPMSTAEMGVIAKFLKDNEITCEPDDEALSDLREEFESDFEAKRKKKQEAIMARSEEEAEQASWI